MRLAKQSVNQSDRPLIEGLFEEAYLFDQTLRTAGAKRDAWSDLLLLHRTINAREA